MLTLLVREKKEDGRIMQCLLKLLRNGIKKIPTYSSLFQRESQNKVWYEWYGEPYACSYLFCIFLKLLVLINIIGSIVNYALSFQ